ncbi:MAG: response regulator [Pseudomonadota bacterium]
MRITGTPPDLLMPIRRIIAYGFAGLALVVVVAVWLRLAQVSSAKDLVDVQSRRAEALNVGESMRQKCRELSRFARAYVDTGDARYREIHERIIAIRDGQSPRPDDYNPSFWDRFLLQGDAGLSYRPPLSLDLIMQQAGISEREAMFLREAKRESDALVLIERRVFADFDAKLVAAGGDFARINATPERRRLHDAAYNAQVGRIMERVEAFIAAVELKTVSEVTRLTEQIDTRRRYQWGLVAVILFGGLFGLVGSRRLIVLPLQRLVDGANDFAAGDYRRRVKPAGTLEVRQLGAAINHMAQAIEDDLKRRGQLEAEAERVRAVAEASRRRLLDIADQAPGIVFEFARDPAGVYSARFVSNGVLEATGVPRQRITADFKHFLDALEPEDRERLLAGLEASAAANCTLRETLCIRHAEDGEQRWLFVNALPRRLDDGTTLWRGFFTDISEQKRLQGELLQARDAARVAEQTKADFLANMSHEIRTPMNAIIGMTHLAFQTDPSQKQLNYLGKIDNAAKSLLGIINDILDFSKIEAGKLAVESVGFSLQDLLENLTDLVGQKAQDKGLAFVFKLDPTVPNDLIGDPLRIGQVLTNFCTNAVKFTDRGEVSVAIDVEERGSDVLLHFAVRDSGIGLTREQKASLFRTFQQADTSTTRKYGGTGLGLSISKRLVELMGGEIGVNSEPGKGSKFWFKLRLGVQENARPLAHAEASMLAGKRLLIVEDNNNAREILSTLASSLKLDVSSTASPAEALALIEQDDALKPFDIVLLDWKLPMISGAETARRIRRGLVLQHPPKLIMVTAYGREEVLQDLGGLEINGLLMKPVNASTLLDALMNAYGKRVLGIGHRVTEDMSAGLKGLRVLLAEDNEVNQEVAQEILGQAGIVVTIANNGQEAIDHLQRAAFDLVLMDLNMPVLDGIAATLEIRRNPQWANLPVIAMTANVMAADIEKCRQAGMQDHIGKPIAVNELFTTLARWAPVRSATAVAAAAAAVPEVVIASAVSDELPERLDGINVAAGLARVGGNKPLFRRLLLKFAQNQALAVPGTRRALQDDDPELALRLAHTLKGVASTAAADGVAEAAARLEAALAAGETDVEPLLAVVQQRLSEALAAIAPLADGGEKTLATGTGDHADVGLLKEKLATLSACIEDNDTDAVDLLESLQALLPQGRSRELLRTLEKHIGAYDFDAARQGLIMLAAQLRIELPAGSKG